MKIIFPHFLAFVILFKHIKDISSVILFPGFQLLIPQWEIKSSVNHLP